MAIDPDTITVPGEGDDPVELTVTNTYDVGTIEVDKELAGLASEIYNVGPFEVPLACTFPDADTPIDIPGGATRQFMPGVPAVYDGLPVGAECTVTETETFGATSTTMTVDDGEPVDGTSADVAVPENDADGPTSVTVTATNTFSTSPVLVRKTVDGNGAQYAPDMPEQPWTIDSIADMPYQVTLECTFEGQAVPIPGGETRRFGPGFPALYVGLPDGAACTMTESDTGGATSFTVEPDSGTIEEQEGPLTPIDVDVTNTYDLGEFQVEKVVDGDGAQYGTGPFEGTPIDMDAEAIGGASRTITPDEPATYGGLPVGADCLVTETESGGATSSTVSTTVEDGEPGQVVVPVADADPATVTVTNTYDLGRFQVEKVVDGDGAAFGTGPFEISAECTFQGEPIEVPGGATREVTPDEPATYDQLPIGAECVVTETDVAGATSSTVSTAVEDGDPGQVVVPGTDADPAVITVTNTFDVGSLAVDKVVDFEGDAYDVGPFEVTVACTFQGADIEVPGGAAREIAAGDTVTYAGLPIGAECVVTETDDGGAASTTVSTVGEGDPGAVTIAAEPASVTVTNTFDALPPPTDQDGDTGGGGWLPTTGADIALWVGLAVLLIAGGVILVGVRRRQQH